MHHNKGKSLHKSLEARIKYVLNPAKTDSGKYVAPSNVPLKLPTPSGLWHIDNTEIGHTENLRRV